MLRFLVKMFWILIYILPDCSMHSKLSIPICNGESWYIRWGMVTSVVFYHQVKLLQLEFFSKTLVYQNQGRFHIYSQWELCFHKHFMHFNLESSLQASFYLVAVVDFKHGCFCRNVLCFNQTQGNLSKVFLQLTSQCWGFMVCFICSYSAPRS